MTVFTINSNNKINCSSKLIVPSSPLPSFIDEFTSIYYILSNKIGMREKP